MLKMLIVDDDQKFIQDIYDSFEFKEMNIYPVPPAKNSKEGFDKLKEFKPDICILEIGSFFNNSLELIETAKQSELKTLFIIATKSEEFDSARKAVELGVFDYLVKPVAMRNLKDTVLRAKLNIKFARDREKEYKSIKDVLNNNLKLLKKEFVKSWLSASLTDKEIRMYLNMYGIDMPDKCQLVLMRTFKNFLPQDSAFANDSDLLQFSIQNVVEELLIGYGNYILEEIDDDIVLIGPASTDWATLRQVIETNIQKYLEHTIRTFMEPADALYDLPFAYSKAKHKAYNESSHYHIINNIKGYLEQHYTDSSLRLNDIASHLKMSTGYISRIFKQEMSMSITDYLIKLRINKSIQYLWDPKLKVYEIASIVGYNSQHYYCEAFKKIMGASPTEFRKQRIANHTARTPK